MRNAVKTLFVVNSQSEAKQALLAANLKSDLLLALSLEAEFFLSSQIRSYKNPLYRFLEIVGPACNYNFLLPNFRVAYDFAKKEDLEGVRDRLGYFLSEFDRSYIFADKLIKVLRPRKIVISKLKNYPGSSVINGSLKPHAIYLLSREKRIPCEFLKAGKRSKTFRQFLGAISNKISFMRKVIPNGIFDLVIIAPPRHILQLKNVIADLRRIGTNLLVITYTLTPTSRQKLRKNVGEYVEKEKLLSGEIERKSKVSIKKIIDKKPWKKLQYKKYQKHPVIKEFLKNKVKDIVENELLENIKDKLIAESFFNHATSKSLLTTTDPDSKVMHFIKIAKNKGIKTIAVQHGVMWSPAPPSVLPISDYFIVWSEMSKQWIQKINDSNKSSLLVGQSPFHSNVKHSSKTRSLNLKILFLATIVILDVNMISYYRKRLFETLEKLKNVDLTVRIHPFQETANLNALIENSTFKARFDKNDNLQDSINECDLVIFDETTAGFDAMISGKPTIFFNPYSGEDYFGIRKDNIGMSILSEKEIDDKLLNYVRDKKSWKFYAQNGKKFAEYYLGIYNPEKLSEVIAAQASR